jgi:hypothetical protein
MVKTDYVMVKTDYVMVILLYILHKTDFVMVNDQSCHKLKILFKILKTIKSNHVSEVLTWLMCFYNSGYI